MTTAAKSVKHAAVAVDHTLDDAARGIQNFAYCLAYCGSALGPKGPTALVSPSAAAQAAREIGQLATKQNLEKYGGACLQGAALSAVDGEATAVAACVVEVALRAAESRGGETGQHRPPMTLSRPLV
ncbi:MAG: hypothetical protein ACRDQZ_12055 [Mycobacteriales bacterium]